MSSTRTGGSVRESTRAGSFTCGSECQVSGRGVADPASSVAPARRARSAATARAS